MDHYDHETIENFNAPSRKHSCHSGRPRKRTIELVEIYNSVITQYLVITITRKKYIGKNSQDSNSSSSKLTVIGKQQRNAAKLLEKIQEKL